MIRPLFVHDTAMRDEPRKSKLEILQTDASNAPPQRAPHSHRTDAQRRAPNPTQSESSLAVSCLTWPSSPSTSRTWHAAQWSAPQGLQVERSCGATPALARCHGRAASITLATLVSCRTLLEEAASGSRSPVLGCLPRRRRRRDVALEVVALGISHQVCLHRQS